MLQILRYKYTIAVLQLHNCSITNTQLQYYKYATAVLQTQCCNCAVAHIQCYKYTTAVLQIHCVAIVAIIQCCSCAVLPAGQVQGSALAAVLALRQTAILLGGISSLDTCRVAGNREPSFTDSGQT